MFVKLEMDIVDGIPLDDFHLDQRIYERSKNWASFMKRSLIWEDDEEYFFDDICSAFENDQLEEDDHESDDDLDSLDKSVELNDEVEGNSKEICNMSVLKLRRFSESIAEKRNSRKLLKNKIGKLMPYPIKEEPDKEEDELELIEDDVDIQKMVDQTLPILVERKRKWMESGMLHVLNTFDEKKIEEKVGTWLHNNSITQNSAPLHSYTHQAKQLHKHHYCASPKYLCSNYLVKSCGPDTEEESLHSVDTARYIRSNRKPRNGITMNIKAFRLLESKRNALREKYSFPEDDEIEYHRNRIAPINHHHTHKKSSVSNLYHPYGNNCDISLETPDGSRKQNRRRRKILNKRRARTFMVPSSSTTDIYNENTSDEEEELAENKPFVANSYRQWRSQKESMSSNYSLMHQATPKFVLDKIPQRRASECCCCDKIKLCTGIRHLADTSTEEWFVENCLTPKRTLKKKILEKQNNIRKGKILKDNSIEKNLQEKLKTERRRAESIAIGIDQVQELVVEKDLKGPTGIQKESYNTEVPTSKKRKYEDRNKKTKNERKANKPILEGKRSGKKQKAKIKNIHDVEDNKESAFKIDLDLKMNNLEVCGEKILNKKLNTIKDPSFKTSVETKTKNTVLEVTNNIAKIKDSVLEKELKETIEIKEILKDEDDNKKFKNERKKEKEVLEEGKKSIKKQKVKEKNIHKKTTSKHDKEKSHESTFERDLSLAIKISSKLYEEEIAKQILNTEKDHNISAKRKTQNRILEKLISKTNEKKSSSKKKKEKLLQVSDKSTESNKSSSDEETQILKASKEQRRKSLELLLSKISTMSSNSSERKLKPQPKSIKLKHINQLKEKMSTVASDNNTAAKDATFFAIKNSNICNSTAMSNGGIAAAKELSSAPSSRSSNYTANNDCSKLKSLSPRSDDTDCAVVSSTTRDIHSINNKGILLYTPRNHNLVPAQSISNGLFTLTKDHLSSVVGERISQKFFKHNKRTLCFDANLSVFFQPPSNINNEDSASDSDDDPLEHVQEHGKLYVSFSE